MSRRFSPPSASINLDCRDLLVNSLLGEDVPMTGQILIGLDEEVLDPNGGKILFSDESPAEVALRRWRAGSFEEAEKIAATEWRKSTRGIDLEAMRRKLQEDMGYVIPVTSFETLAHVVNGYVTHAGRQREYLVRLLHGFSADDELKNSVLRRWDTGGFRILSRFAPYAFYCLKVQLAFDLGLYHGLITTKATNYVDSEYLYYLPFTLVFATSDKQQAALAKLFLRPHQQFIDGGELKKDLARIAGYWNDLTDEQCKAHMREYGHYPPEIPNSITYQLWARYMKARPSQAGDPTQLEGEDLEKLSRDVRRQMDLIKRTRAKTDS